jgi:demethylmenaquinone methyltransferase/2-methoxy-6-polyprenyl-1,4-benzoquinol methylase
MPISKEAGRIRRMFADISPRYDLLNHVLSLNADVAWRRAAVRALDLRAGAAVLDVCTGTGDLALEAWRVLEEKGGGLVVGTDFTLEMLRIGEGKRLRRRAAIRLVAADTLELPFAGESFDAVTVAFGIRNVADLEGGLAEMLRVLRPGGRAAILEFSARPGGVLERAYGFYFRRVLPLLGGWISGSRAGRDAYAYLPASVLEFPAPGELSRILERVGFTGARFRSLTFGVAVLHIAIRPAVPAALHAPGA